MAPPPESPSHAILARALELFEQACGLDESTRSAFLDGECGDDARLRRSVEQLLEADRHSAGAWRVAPVLDPGGDATPERIGPYRILSVLGRGGMGVVYEAEQDSPRRRVALKTTSAFAFDAERKKRLEREAEILGQLTHPGIARIYDADVIETSQGLQPYFAMEYVEGLDVVGYAVRERLGVDAMLALVERVCEALQYAHDHGVVHRDIKPDNVLVDTAGRPRIVDFGIARAEEKQTDPATWVTREGMLLGTLSYMSPEQLAADSRAVTGRSDVYALGVVLYQLLTGALPHELGEMDFVAATRVLMESDIVPLPRRDARYRGDLSAIVGKALEKDPARRYATAREFAADLRAFRESRPILAREPSHLYRLRKYTRRHPAVVGMLTVLLVGLASTLVALKHALDNFELAEQRRIDADRSALAAEVAARQADEQAELATRRADEVLRLSALQRVEELHAAADALWPPFPDALPRLERWIDDADERVGELERHRAKRAELMAAGNQDAPETRWWSAQLDKLVAGLEALSDPETGLLADDAVAPPHGWSVPRRLRVARELEQALAPGGEHARRWAAARAEHPGLVLPQQPGLVPLGPDADSGLQAFWHVLSGDEPQRDGDGRFLPTGSSGLVLLLVPGGRFWMGSQHDEPEGVLYDPRSQDDERPPRDVTLSPYLLSKYELTQGQWLRMTGAAPSQYGPHMAGTGSGWSASWLAHTDEGSLRHPVESVTWYDCATWLPRFDLELPTEAQWEFACRAGTDTAWWTGDDVASLAGAANVADSYAKSHGAGSWKDVETELDDGATIHAPVGHYRPNPLGFHDMHGNVFEWCRDGFHGAIYADGPATDPLGSIEDSLARVCRGGGYAHAALGARSAVRLQVQPAQASNSCGVRPARAIVRPPGAAATGDAAREPATAR